MTAARINQVREWAGLPARPRVTYRIAPNDSAGIVTRGYQVLRYVDGQYNTLVTVTFTYRGACFARWLRERRRAHG